MTASEHEFCEFENLRFEETIKPLLRVIHSNPSLTVRFFLLKNILHSFRRNIKLKFVTFFNILKHFTCFILVMFLQYVRDEKTSL